MKIIIGSARVDENGKFVNGAAGDQKQKTNPDYKGEVSLQEFYDHPKRWIVMRPKLVDHAIKIAKNMETACNNPNVGYDQNPNQRTSIIKDGADSKKKTETDCSALVRDCIKEATGKDPGNFTTANEVNVLLATGLFEPVFTYTPDTKLYTGDILVTATKGHTVVVTSGYKRPTKTNDDKQDKKNDQKPQAYKVIAKSGLNIRAGQSKVAKKVGVMPYGATFIVDKKTTKWLHGTYNGKYIGWCYAEYLRRN